MRLTGRASGSSDGARTQADARREPDMRQAASHRVGSAPMPIITSVVGSYPQPDWLIDRAALGARLPPRVRALELWRVAEAWLEQAQDDATRLAIADMERAGVDIVSDGEQRRESY